ncbi:substrate-binding domain-containing protein [Clostridium estertheticum]|uniref:substrate-binding domain-containing protein n=1 Tax=Clostridium estertheticum TaxID=238834 RepID=UPI0013E90796|nr:substrate-binding domain-containing protein [Clostridium estertheticum]MBZ9686472.1 substrate-binding domain-containing protein [Clostridium estertheticum]
MVFTITACSKKERSMVLATTTSTQDSGLLDYLLPLFEKDTGIKVKVLAKGTGEALEVAKRGDADGLLVHAKAQELQFVKDGFGTERLEVMYNDFIIVGPKDDPAKLLEKTPSDAIESFKLISSSKATFISRGDKSGTNTKELAIWKSAGITPTGTWYVSAGKGMGAVLQMADEKKAYTLTDRATYLSMKDKLELKIVTEKGSGFLNQYAFIRLDPTKNKIKTQEANEFIDWMISSKGQKLIGEYGKDKYGQTLFIPNAKK